MSRWGGVLLLPLLLLLPPVVLPNSAPPTAVKGGKKEFRIAWMAPRKQYNKFSAATSVNALKLALYYINEKLLKDYSISVKWYDSDCSSKSALTSAVDARDQFKPHLFLGPPCSAGMRPVAQLASHWNIPVFGWVSNDHDLRDRNTYSTLIRLLGPLNQFSSTMRYVSSLFGWNRYAMIHDKDESYKSVYEALAQAVDTTNFFTSTHSVTPSMDEEEIKVLFLQVKKYARILIFAVPWLTMRKYILVAHRLGLTTGEFAFICINGDVYSGEALEADVLSDRGWRRNDSYDDEARFAFESVIHVILAGQEKNVYTTFTGLVQKMKTRTNPLWDIPEGSDQLDAYAPFLYDATVLWAVLVNKSLVEGGDPTNGSYIFSQASGVETRGVTNKLVLDNSCDRLVNIWFLDMQEDGHFKTITKIYNSNDGGTVLSGLDKGVKEKDMEDVNVRWPDGKVGRLNAPPDKPACGFEGEKCVKIPEKPNLRYTDTIIGAAAGSSVVLIIAIAVQISLRRYRRRRQLESMLWQVKFEEIDFVTAILCGSVRSSFKNLARRRSSKNTKLIKARSAASCADSIESWSDSPRSHHCTETGTTMFGSVAYLRGSLVSVKRMSKNSVNITKEVLLELNRLIELKNQNVCAFVGACVDPGRILLLWEYCAKGSLQDIIWNTNIKLDQLFKFALCQDVAKGLEYIHKSPVNYHGNLKSSNCVVDSRWTCKLTDFGVPKIRSMDKASIPFEENAEKELWTAPEILRAERNVDFQKADIYSLGIILKEVFTRSGPYTEYPFYNSSEIIAKVREPSNNIRFRPSIARELRQHPDLVGLIDDCWSEDVSARPSAPRVVKSLTRINPSKHMTMIDNMIAMLEKYANHLEELVAERTSELDAEKRKTENLLYRMLPQSVAEDLKLGKPVKAEMFDQATIYFSDIVGFTKICGESTPIEVVNLLNCLYTLFDDIITRYDVYKVETIGDAYMIASGLPTKNGDNHIKEITDCAMDILASTTTFIIPHLPDRPLKIRIGIHTGSVVAGVVGLAMPRYCLFGDTVNVASRMESTGLPLKIHMSSMAHDKLVSRFAGYHFYDRGEIPVKGKGTMNTFFLTGRDGFSKVLPTSDHCSPGSPACTFGMFSSIPDCGTHTREGSHSIVDMPLVTSTPCKADVAKDTNDSGYHTTGSPGGHVAQNATHESREHSTSLKSCVTPVHYEHSTVHMKKAMPEHSRTSETSHIAREPHDPSFMNASVSDPIIVSHINRLTGDPIDVSHQIVAHMNSLVTEPTIISHINLVTSKPCEVGTNVRAKKNMTSEPTIISHINRVTTEARGLSKSVISDVTVTPEPKVITHINRVTAEPTDLPNSIVTQVTAVPSEPKEGTNIVTHLSTVKSEPKDVLNLENHLNTVTSEPRDVPDLVTERDTVAAEANNVSNNREQQLNTVTSKSKDVSDNTVTQLNTVTSESKSAPREKVTDRNTSTTKQKDVSKRAVTQLNTVTFGPQDLLNSRVNQLNTVMSEPKTVSSNIVTNLKTVASEPKSVSSNIVTSLNTVSSEPRTVSSNIVTSLNTVSSEPRTVSSNIVTSLNTVSSEPKTVSNNIVTSLNTVSSEPKTVSSNIVTQMNTVASESKDVSRVTQMNTVTSQPNDASSNIVTQTNTVVSEPNDVSRVTQLNTVTSEPKSMSSNIVTKLNTVASEPKDMSRVTQLNTVVLEPNDVSSNIITALNTDRLEPKGVSGTIVTELNSVTSEPKGVPNCTLSHLDTVTSEPAFVNHINRSRTEPLDLSKCVLAHVNRAYEHDEEMNGFVNFTRNSHIKSATVPRCTSPRASLLTQKVPCKVDVDIYNDQHKRRTTRRIEMTPL